METEWGAESMGKIKLERGARSRLIAGRRSRGYQKFSSGKRRRIEPQRNIKVAIA
jgi:hypothetical protein